MQYSDGQTVFIDAFRVARGVRRSTVGTNGPPLPVVIHTGFVGRDGREWYIYERPGFCRDMCTYDALPYSALYDSETAGRNFEKQMLDPRFAKQFLKRAGILDENGELAKHYRGA